MLIHIYLYIASCDEDVSWLTVFYRFKMSRPVQRQPQALSVSSDAAEWASGVCDCCDDMTDCTVTLIVISLRENMTKLLYKYILVML